MKPGEIPEIRVEVLSEAPLRAQGRLVLYWMTVCRRTTWNFGLQRAVDWARHLGQPLLVVEVLPCGGRWDNDRHHRFVLDGMADNARRLTDSPARYYPYVEPEPGEATALFEELARLSCAVVTDMIPIPRSPKPQWITRRLDVRIEAVDGNGLLPLAAADRAFTTAHAFRRFLHRTLPEHLIDLPQSNPLSRIKLAQCNALPRSITRRWPAASKALLAGRADTLAALPLDHSVATVSTTGGPRAARAALKEFLELKLARYDRDRSQPEEEVASGLSPYLHHGHISTHEIFHALATHLGWSPADLCPKAGGKRRGFWGLSEPAEAFLDQLVTWRELGSNMCAKCEDFDRYESLPDWARQTLRKHARDRREYTYTLDEFEQARTHDCLWNAGQMQLVREGRLHNYLRMLWGKKILQWTDCPEEALDVMIQLNNKYALDGQDPNSYSGIFWVLGRYDRAWGPERPVFGKIRYMSSKNTARKVRVKRYIEKFASDQRESLPVGT